MSQERIISKMNERGWIFDIESKPHALLFFSSSCTKIAMRFKFWKDVTHYLNRK